MERLDRRQIQAIVSLQMSEDFKIFVEWLRTSRDKEQDALTNHKDEILMRWSQGKTQLLNDQLNTIDNARETFNRMK
jgi:hypothetical protein